MSTMIETMGRAKRPRVLVLATWFPYPPDNGSRQRLWALLSGLGERYEVDLLGILDEAVAPDAVAHARERCAHVEVVQRRPFRPRSVRAIAAFLHRLPRAVVTTDTPAAHAAVERLVADRGYDAVVVSQIHVARYALCLSGLVRVLDDLEPQGLRTASPESTLRDRLRDALTWVKVRRYVETVVRTFDATVVVSEREREAVLALAPDARVEIVPNGVDTDVNRVGLAEVQRDTMVYSGAPTFGANLEAVRWFAKDVLPAVRAARPGARFVVTGRIDSLPAESLPVASGLTYAGYLDDVRPAIASSWCTVVPLRRGGGTRLKVLESLALGTPVVSTTKGVEGLDLVPGQEVLVADTAEAFAATVIDLMQDPLRRDALATAGRRAVEERYDWRPIARRFTDLVGSVESRSSHR
jgi:glycosyltransferase involved in cell wall biosynthesis